MAASPFLYRILSKPKQNATDAWDKSFCSDILPSAVGAKVVSRAAYYHAYNDFVLATKTPLEGNRTALHAVELVHADIEPPMDKTCLAMCQVDKVGAIDGVDLPKERIGWDARIYKLIQDFDPNGVGHTPSPFILNVQNEPADDDDYNQFYRDEHLHMLNKVPGYRRSQRYELVSSQDVKQSQVPRFMAVHEFDHLDALDGPELREADASPNTHRVFGTAKKVNVRGFKLVQTFGDMR